MAEIRFHIRSRCKDPFGGDIRLAIENVIKDLKSEMRRADFIKIRKSQRYTQSRFVCVLANSVDFGAQVPARLFNGSKKVEAFFHQCIVCKVAVIGSGVYNDQKFIRLSQINEKAKFKIKKPFLLVEPGPSALRLSFDIFITSIPYGRSRARQPARERRGESRAQGQPGRGEYQYGF